MIQSIGGLNEEECEAKLTLRSQPIFPLTELGKNVLFSVKGSQATLMLQTSFFCKSSYLIRTNFRAFAQKIHSRNVVQNLHK